MVDNNIVAGIAVIGDQGKAQFIAGKFNFVGVNVFHGQVADLAILLDNGIGLVHCCHGNLGFNVLSSWGIAGIASLEHGNAVRAARGHGVCETIFVFTHYCVLICGRGDRDSLVSIRVVALAVVTFIQVQLVTEVGVQTVRDLRHVRVASISSVRVVVRLRNDVVMGRSGMGLVNEVAITTGWTSSNRAI